MEARKTIIVLLIALAHCADADPTCEYNKYGSERKTMCIAGSDDYVLKPGLVSNNKQTTEISLRACRIISIDPDSFLDLLELRKLDLSENKIGTLKIRDLEGAAYLTHLNLSYNMINEIPLGFFDHINSLEYLNLKGNRITRFAEDLFDPLTRLGFLDLSSNSFLGQNFGSELFEFNSKITFMDFSGSDMTGAPDSLLSSFQIINLLNLAGCSLRVVPKFATASNLKSMTHLIFVNNEILKLDSPTTFVNLVNLEILNFANNRIEVINEEVFKPLTRLRTIVLTNNRLTDIPQTLFTRLTNLDSVDLSNNRIENLPTEAFTNTAISNLDLTGNRITYLPTDFCSTLKNTGVSLKQFSFSRNPWQCACLKELLSEVKLLKLNYNDELYNGKVPVCVTGKEFRCKRVRNVNKQFIDMFNNLNYV